MRAGETRARSRSQHRTTLAGAAPELWSQARSATAWPTRPRHGARGPRSTRPTRDRGATSCTTAAGCSTRSPTTRPARSCAAPTTSLPETAGRVPQLGLPLRLGARRELHHPGAVGGGLPRRGRQVLRLPGGRGGVAGAAGQRPADHVRHRRRARSHRARAAPSHRLARQRAGAGRQRRVEPAPARRLRRAARRRRTGSPSSSTGSAPTTRQFLADLADTAAARWQEQDQGIWEVRGEPRDFLYSKLMCWVALDRAIMLADRLGAADRVDALDARPRRDRRRDPHPGLERGGRRVHPVVRLRRPRRVEPDDADRRVPRRPTTPACWPRSTPSPTGSPTSTASSTATSPTTGSRARRARSCCARSGWRRRSRSPARSTGPARRSSGPIAYVNDVGLLAEEVDPDTGELLGNFPQAFSHIGLVNAAWAISQAEE